MTPEAALYLAAADEALSDARRILSVDIPRQAARLAYYAQFHAAQALIFERTGKIAKTHKGVDRQFHKVARTEPLMPDDLKGTLASSYYYKDVADYQTGPTSSVTQAQARSAIVIADRFVTAIRQSLTPGSA